MVSRELTVSVLVSHVDVAVLEGGALLRVLVALQLGDQRRLAALLVAWKGKRKYLIEGNE